MSQSCGPILPEPSQQSDAGVTGTSAEVLTKGTSKENTSQQKLQELLPQPPTPLKSGIKFFHKTLTNVWFYVAAASLVANLVHTFSPTLQVSTTSLNPADPAASSFAITDTSPWTFTNVHVGCDVSSGPMHIRVADTSFIAGPGAPTEGPAFTGSISPGETVTRDCGVGSASNFIRAPIDPSKLRIDLTVTYNWLWGYAPGSIKRHFNTRHATGGTFVLVPDVEDYKPPFVH